jgi:hypothetical protein
MEHGGTGNPAVTGSNCCGGKSYRGGREIFLRFDIQKSLAEQMRQPLPELHEHYLAVAPFL